MQFEMISGSCLSLFSLSNRVGVDKHSPNRKEVERTCTEFYVPDETDYKKALKGNPLSCLTTMYDRSVIGDLYF